MDDGSLDRDEAPPNRDEDPEAEIRLLGAPSFTARGRQWPLPRKAFVLFAILALSPGSTTSRARARGILWGNRKHSSAAANLRQLLTRISRVERASGCQLLTGDGDTIRLAPMDISIDLLAFSPPKLRVAAGDPVALMAAVRSYAGELLAELHPDDEALDEWLTRERANVKAAFITAAVTLLQAGTAPPSDDLEVAGRLLAVDPTHEAGYRARIRAYGLKGDISRSRAAYLECEKVLRSELGVLPSPETQALAARFFDAGGAVPPLPAEPTRPQQPATATPPDTSRPRVVILPPVDPFDDIRLRRLCNFMLEDLTIGLSRYRSFRVIAAHTAIAMASGTMGRMNARDWCDYVLASSIGSAGNSFELKFRLTDARNSEVIWASSVPFDGADLPSLFNALSDRAVTALADAVERREIERPMPPEDMGAYRLFLEGRRFSTSTALQELRRARRLFRDSIRREPGFAAARAGIARTKSMEWLIRGAPDPLQLVEAVAYADEAITSDERDARGFREKAFALLYMKRHDESLALFSEAANRNPNDADLLADYADALAHSGDPASGLTVLDRAMILNPSPPTVYRWIGGSIYYQMRRYYDAIALLEPARRDPATARLLAACYAQVGDVSAARASFRLARQSLPDISTEKLWVIVPNRDSSDTQHLIDGLRRAGLS